MFPSFRLFFFITFTLHVSECGVVNFKSQSGKEVLKPGDHLEVNYIVKGSKADDYWIGLFPWGECPKSNTCFNSYSPYLPIGTVRGTTLIPLKQVGIYDLRLCKGKYGLFAEYECEDDASRFSVRVSSCGDVMDAGVILTEASTSPAIAVEALCSVTVEIRLKMALPERQVLTWVSPTGESGKEQDMEVTTNGESRRGLNDVGVVLVPSFTEGRAIVRVTSRETRRVMIAVSLTILVPCAPKCAHGRCDMTMGKCLCDPGYFGQDCAMLHSKWMRTQVPKHPLLLIPGVGGSRIIAENEATGDSKNCWVDSPSSAEKLADRIADGDDSLGEANIRKFLLAGRFNFTTGLFESDASVTNGGWNLLTPKTGYGLDSIENLVQSEGLLRMFLKISGESHKAEYFAPLIRSLTAAGFARGRDLFGFPYDWRQSVRSSATVESLRATIEEIHERTKRKVHVVTHSMGGLLFQAYLALYPKEAAARVSLWAAVACPFHGAPGAATLAFLRGHTFGNPFLSHETAREMAAAMPSTYELLGDPKYKWAREPRITYTMADGAKKTITAPLARGFDLDTALSCGARTYDGAAATWARDTSDVLRFASIPASLSFVPVFGTTALRTTPGSFVAMSPIHSLCDLVGAFRAGAGRASDLEVENVDGDGDVPLESARGDTLSAVERLLVPDVKGHVDLIKDPRLAHIVRSLTGTECSFEGVWSHGKLEFSLYQFGTRVYGHLASGYRFSGQAKHGRLEGLVFHDKIPSSSYLSAEIHPHCLSLSAVYRNSTDLRTLANSEMSRVIGAQCEPGNVAKCKVRHGIGLRSCSFGWWSTQCQVSKCDDGFHMEKDKVLGQVSCENSSDEKLDFHVENSCVKSEKEPFLCTDGSCAQNIETCLKRGRYLPSANPEAVNCPLEKPIICSDKSCVRLIENCEKKMKQLEEDETAKQHRLPGFSCKAGETVICPMGNCAVSRDLCEPHFNDLNDHHQMNGKASGISPNLEGNHGDAYVYAGEVTGALKCARAGVVFCGSLNRCVENYSKCPPFALHDGEKNGLIGKSHAVSSKTDTRCPLEKPFSCLREKTVICVKNSDDCFEKTDTFSTFSDKINWKIVIGIGIIVVTLAIFAFKWWKARKANENEYSYSFLSNDIDEEEEFLSGKRKKDISRMMKERSLRLLEEKL